MRNAILLTLIGVVVVSLVTLGAVYAIPQEPSASLSESSQEISQPAPTDQAAYPYLLRAYEGKLAVFTSDLVQPDMVFDVYVRTLPEFDQEELARGIRVESYERLTKLIEDYIS